MQDIINQTNFFELSYYCSGDDAKKFIQGLCTNDVMNLNSIGDCVAAAFLSPKV